jgi:hypothetical protein
MTLARVTGACLSAPRLKKSYGIVQLKMTGGAPSQEECSDIPPGLRGGISRDLYYQYRGVCTDSTELGKKFSFLTKTSQEREFSLPCTHGTAGYVQGVQAEQKIFPIIFIT